MGTLIIRVVLLALSTIGAACAQAAPTTPAQRFAGAVGYDRWVAGDTARREEWSRNHAGAGAAVAALAPRIEAIAGRWHVLVVAESWCGDAVSSVPYLARLTEAQPAIELRLLRTKDAQDLLRAHPLDGRSATPLVIVYDAGFVERGVWIERPAALRALIRSLDGHVPDDSLRAAVRVWRETDAGRSMLAEVLGLIERAAASADSH